MSKIIRTIHKPTILLEDIAPVIDSEVGEASNQYTGLDSVNRTIDYSKRTGLQNFFITINGMVVNPDGIEKCKVDMNGFYPVITIRFQQDFEEFVNLGLPKDGDILSIFYRSTLDELKPLRLDFVVTDVVTEYDNFFVVFGVVNIQKLFKDSSFFHKGDSLETLKELSKELKLGFATNETKVDDSQTWLCANEPFDVFIRDVKKHIWKDAKSYFDCYIDNFYILNYVNVFEQFDLSKEFKVGVSLNKIRNFIEYAKDSVSDVKDESITYLYPTILHNYRDTLEVNHQITDMKILNTSSRISLEEGYVKVSHFFDYSLGEKVEIISESLTSQGKEKDYMSLKGKVTDTKWKENTRHVWNGVAYNLPDHNTHQFYNQAKIQNEHNLKETDKFTIEVTLGDINFNIYRYMVIPVLWYEYGDVAKKKRLYESEDYSNIIDNDLGETVPYVLNEFISGFYVVKGYSYEFIGAFENKQNSQVVQHKLILSRVEFPKTLSITSDGSVMSNYNYDVEI